MGDALVTDFNDPLGVSVNRPLVVAPVVLQLHDAVETFSTIAGAQISMVILEALGDLRDIFPVEPVPERRHDRIDGLAALGPVHHLTLGKGKPFPAAIVTLE